MGSRLLTLLAALLTPALALAQIGTQGSFFGTVTDESGGVVGNAQVTATNLATGFTRVTKTAPDGNFEILALPIGPYTVSVTANGFKKWELSRADLNVGDRDRISPVLQVGDVTQSISVQGAADVLQTEKADVESVIQMQEIRELPLATRNPLALVSMVPGMRYESTENGGERATYVQGQGLRDNKTAFQLNGLNSNAPMDEGGTAIPNVDAVAEFNVQTLDFSAESGRDPMQVLVVTKAGTNEFHGALWEFLQNDALNARNTFAVSKNRVRYNQFGASLGGPVIHNKTFFYANFQGTVVHNQTIYNSLAVTPAMKSGDFSALSKTIKDPVTGNPFPGNKIPASRINSASSYFLPLILEPNSPDGRFKTNATAPNDTWEGTLRVDHELTNAQHLSGNWVTVRQPQTVLGYNPSPSITGYSNVVQNNIALNYTWTISPRTLLMASGGTMRTNQTYGNPHLGKQNDDDLAGIQGFPTAGRQAWIGPPDIFFGSGYTGVSFPGGWGVPGSLWGNVYNGKVSLNHIIGVHNLMTGFEYGDWHTFGQHGQPNLNAFPITPFLAAATQGLWTTARQVGYPDGLYQPNGNWAPRLGIAYRPWSQKGFVVRGGYGIYYNSFTGNRGGSATGNVPFWTIESQTIGLTTLQNWQTMWPSNPSAFTAFQVYAPAYNIRPARTHEWNVSLQTALPFKSALTVSYVGTLVGNEVGADQYNEATIGPHKTLQADRPHPAYSGVQVYQNFGRNWYHGLQTKIERRFDAGLAFTFAYSYSRSMESNTPDCETCSLIPYSPSWYNRGRTPFDFRHIEYATIVWDVPVGRSRKYLSSMNRFADAVLGGWELAATEQAQSGAPLTIYGGLNNLGNGWGTRANLVGNPEIANPSPAAWFNTTAFVTPPLYTFGSAGMGILDGPGVLSINTSLAKNFYVTEQKFFQFRWESYNLPNRVNYNNPDTTVTDTAFGRITGAGSARYMQLALKFIF